MNSSLPDDLLRNRIAAALRDLDQPESAAELEAALDAIDSKPLSDASVRRILASAKDAIASRPTPADRPTDSRWIVALSCAVLATLVVLVLGTVGRFGRQGSPPSVAAPTAIGESDLATTWRSGPRLLAPDHSQRLAVGASLVTGPREKRRVTLPDGSVLSINEQSRVTVTTARRLRLEQGELFVEVEPTTTADPRERFVVETPLRAVTALGTKFVVKALPTATNVVVTQGQVQVSGEEAVVPAGQELIVDNSNAVQRRPAKRTSHVVEWIKDLMAAGSFTIPPSEHAGGSVTVVDPNGQELKLSLRKFHIDVHIEDGFARTTIDQTYFNHTWQQLEGTFRFPLPADASLSRLAMYVNGTLMEGGMVERDHGRNVFEQIRHTRRDPALLEWVDGSTFRMRVFPLEPRQEKRIILSYSQRLPLDYGKSVYRFPSGHNLEGVRQWSTEIRVKGGAEQSWHSPTHVLEARPDGGDLVLTGRDEHVLLDNDLVVEFAVTPAAAPSAPLAPRWSVYEQDGFRYVMVRTHPTLKAEPTRRSRHWIFLVENSGDRDTITVAAQRQIVKSLLENVEHTDSMSIVRAATQATLYRPQPVECSAANVSAALEFLEARAPLGALDLGLALDAVSHQAHLDRDTWIVHVGSGIAVWGERDESTLSRRLPSAARYVGVAVGRRWSKSFMETAAARTGGTVTQINPDEPVAWRAFELLSQLNAPRLTEIQVAAPGDHAPEFLALTPQIADGQEVAAVARWAGDSSLPAVLHVTGKLNGQAFRQELAIPATLFATTPRKGEPLGAATPVRAGHLPRTWARLKIDQLVALGTTEHRADIIQLSKAMYVMSPFTSLLVLETEAMYAQFNVDRGRKDHWALYPAPATIPVTPADAGPQPSSPLEAGRERLAQLQSRLKAAQAQRDRAVVERRPAGDIARLERLLRIEQMEEKRLAAELRRIEQSQSAANDPVRKAWASVVWRVPSLPSGRVASQLVWRYWNRPSNNSGPATWDDYYWNGADDNSHGIPLGWAQPQLFFGDERTRLAADLRRFIAGGRGAGFQALQGLERWSVQGVASELFTDPVLERFALYDGIEGRRSYRELPFLSHFGPDGTHRIEIIDGVSNTALYSQFAVFGNTLLQSNDANGLGTVTFQVAGGDSTLRRLEDAYVRRISGAWPRDWIGDDGEVRTTVRILAPDEKITWNDFEAVDYSDTGWLAGEPSVGLARALARQGQIRANFGFSDELLGSHSFRSKARQWTAPRYGGLIRDLPSYAPGLQTWEADRLAVTYQALPAERRATRGRVDEPAKRLIDKARSLGWRKFRALDAQGRPASPWIVAQGAGLFVYDRTTIDGLVEQVVCDGKTLWQLYPELGLGARRSISQFHQATLQRLMPGYVPSLDDLSAAADVTIAGPRTIRITPRPAPLGAAQGDREQPSRESPGGASESPRLQLVFELTFAEDGRLAETRVLDVTHNKLLAIQTIDDQGTVRRLDGEHHLQAELRFESQACDAPNLVPATQGLVVLPLPFRSMEGVPVSVTVNLPTGSPDYAKLSDSDAMQLVATYFAAYRPAELGALIEHRFTSQGDQRVGFAVLLSAVQHNHPLVVNAPTRFPDSPLGQYLPQADAWIWTNNVNGTLDGGPKATPFVRRLCDLYNHDARWRSDRGVNQGRPAKDVETDLNDTLRFVRELQSPESMLRILTVVHEACERHQRLTPAFAALLLGTANALAEAHQAPTFAADLRIRWHLAGADAPSIQRAETLLTSVLQTIVADGGLPPVDGQLRDAFVQRLKQNQDQPCGPWSRAYRQAAVDLLAGLNPTNAQARRLGLLDLARQCAALTEKSLAADIYAMAVRDQDLATDRALNLATLRYAQAAADWKLVETTTRRALADAELAKVPTLWRDAAQASLEQQDLALWAGRMDRALELEFDALPKMVDLSAFRADYQNVLGQLEKSLERTREANLPGRDALLRLLVRMADRWRELDAEESVVCYRTAEILAKAGLTSNAWDYWTTPLAAAPEQSATWRGFAQQMQQHSRTSDAERAWTIACQCEPTNPELLMQHAEFLVSQNQLSRAKALWQRVANGTWQPRFDAIKQQAVQQLQAHP